MGERSKAADQTAADSPPGFGLGARLAVSLTAGALLAGSFPPYGVSFLLPVGFALLLTAVDGVRPRHGFYLGFACGVIYFGATLFWLSNLFEAAAVSLVAIAATFPGMFGAAFGFVRAKWPTLPVWVVAPALWTGIEYFRSEPFPLNFGWMGFGYGVVNAPVMAALASCIGCYGVTFAACVFGSVMKRDWWPMAAVVWLVMLTIRWPAPQPVNPLHARLVQAMSDDEEDLSRLSKAPGRKPDVILWPEYSIHSNLPDDATVWRDVTALARETGTVLVFGAKERAAGAQEEFHNTAFVIGTDGMVLGKHHKNHPVHFIKDGIAGTDARSVATPLGRLGVAVCFDMDFPEVARRLAQDGAEVFIVPNMDPAEWGDVQREQHRLMFQMRAAECGKWLARADVAGGTSVAAPNGQEVARIGSGEPGRLDAVVGRSSGRTIYVRGGWVFGPSCLAACLALFAASLVRRRVRVSAE